MTISKKELLSNLKVCLDCAGNKISPFIFHEGKLISVGSTMAVSIEMAGSEELEGSVNTDTFFKAVSKINNDEIELSMDGDSFVIKAGRSRTKILNNGDYGSNDIFASLKEEKEWLPIPSTLFKAFELCNIDKNNSIIKGVFVSGNKVYTTDKAQIISYTMDGELPKFLIPQESVNVLLKHLKLLKEVSINEKFAFFKNDDMTIAVRLYDSGKYIPEDRLNMILNDEKNICLEGKLPDKLIDAVDRASLFGKKSNTDKIIVVVAFDDKVIHVTSKSAEGEFSEDVEYDITPETPVVTYMSYDILSFLQKRPSEFKLSFDMNLGIGNKIMFISENCKYVSMLFNGEGK